MRIDKLHLENYRNYVNQTVDFDPVCNVIYGENAQGKTNLLEALVCLSCGKSPRTRTDRDLIRSDAQGLLAPGFLLEGTIFSREREFLSRIEVQAGRKKKISVNRVPAKSAVELSQVLGTVFFSPEDLLLIREGAAARRRFLDDSLCQLRPRYAAALTEYNRLHEHKTRLLRDCEERPDLMATLPDFSYRMAQAGAVLIHYRARFAGVLAKSAAAAHRECSGGREELEVRYRTVSSVTDPFAGYDALVGQLMEHQERHRAAELAVRQCLSGPHKDDLEVLINGRSAKSYGSQGQTRTAALALKLAAREIHREVIGEYPILLLDDVLSELDPRRQEFVLNRLGDGQVFITCCEDDRLGALLTGKVFHVREGEGPLMYLHIGNNISIPTDDIIGIFDLDNASTARSTRAFLRSAEEEGMVITVGSELPKSLVVCCPRGSWQRVYISPLAPATLLGRFQAVNFEKEDQP